MFGVYLQSLASKINSISLYLTVVAIKQAQETCLCPCGALDTSESQVVPGPLQVAQIHQEVRNPQTRPLPNSGQLCRSAIQKDQVQNIVDGCEQTKKVNSLKVGVAQRREGLVLLCKCGQPLNTSSKLENMFGV